jgi:hypothetical protein
VIGAGRRREGGGWIEPAHATAVGRHPVAAPARLDDVVDGRHRQALSGPIDQEPEAVEPGQAVAGREPEQPARIGEDALHVRGRQALGRAVGAEGKALGVGGGRAEQQGSGNRAGTHAGMLHAYTRGGNWGTMRWC